MVVENVVGAQKWVGDARWHFGSYYLWGDVPALMPFTYHKKNNGGSCFGRHDGKELARNDPRDMRRNEDGEYVNAAAQGGWNHPGKALDGTKVSGLNWSNYGKPGYKAEAFNGTTEKRLADGVKQEGLSNEAWFDRGMAKHSSRSSARRAASALIARIPYGLAHYIASVYLPR